MSTDFNIRPARPGDEQSILAAFAHSFRDHRSKEVWHWIYRDNPDAGISLVCVNANGEIAAHSGASWHRAIYQGQCVKIGQCRDAFSTAKFRSLSQGRAGLFVQTTRTLFADYGLDGGISFYYGFPSARHWRLGCRQLGYREGCNWGRFVCDLRKTASYHHVFGYLAAISEFGAEFDRLWRVREKSLSAAVIHDSRFLSWRFSPRSGRRYWSWAFTPYLSDGISGYVVFAPQKNKALLLDLHLPPQTEAVRSFWMQVTEQLRWHGIVEVETQLSLNHPDLGRLRDLGFMQHPLSENTKFCFRLFDNGPDWAVLNEQFCFTLADADSF